MIDIRQLQRALHNLVTKVRDERLYGTLGRREADGSRTIHNPLRPGFVMVEMDGGTLNEHVRWLGDVALRQGMRVRILVTHDGDHILEGEDYRIMEADPLAPRDEHGVRPHLHTFVALTDTPAAYTGDAGKVVKVNATEDGLEFVTGGGGAVDSVNGQTGTVVLDADDIDDTSTANKFATAAELSAIATAVQPGDLDDVAFSGDYADLSGTPTIPAETGAAINAAAADTPLDADKFGFWDVVDAALKSVTWANIKTALSAIFVVLAGKSGGQHIRGGTAASESLTLESTSHATKGHVILQPTNGNVGIRTSTPDATLTIRGPFARFSSEVDYLMGNASQSSFMQIGQGLTNNLFYGWTYNAVAANAYAAIHCYAGNNPLILQIAGGNVGIGLVAPQGKLHVLQDGVNHMIVGVSGVAGTAVTVLAAGFVTGKLSYTINIKDSSGNSIASVGNLALGASAGFITASGHTVTLAVTAGGGVTLQRTAGTRTFNVGLDIMWQ